MTTPLIESSASSRRRLSKLRFRISPEMLVTAAAVYFVLFCNARFWDVLLGGRSNVVQSMTLIVSTFFLLTGCHIMLLLPFSARRTIKPVLLLLLVANALTVYFMDQFGVYVNKSMMRNVVHTDSAEIVDLLSWGMIPYVLGYAVVPGILVLRTQLESARLGVAVRNKATLFAVGIAALCIGGIVSGKEYSSFFRNNESARYLVTPGNYIVSTVRIAFSSGRELRGKRIPVGTDATIGSAWRASERPVLFVLVVGETARASSFSLDGYERDTNPLLGAASGLINFVHVSACGTSTADSVPCMFSHFSRKDPEQDRAREFESLLDVVSHSGLDVSWADNNSGCQGTCDRVEKVELESFASRELCASGECFDEVLLTALDSRLATERSGLLVLHQKGSHGPAYYRRYPKRFEKFVPACNSEDLGNCTQEQIRNAYDNSILYTDYFLSRVIERLDAASDRYHTAILYVSDHGESLGEQGFYLHGLPYVIAPEAQTRVPMVLWMSTGFVHRFSLNRDGIAQIAAAERWSHDNLFHSVLGALDIETSVYDPSLDIFERGRQAGGRASSP